MTQCCKAKNTVDLPERPVHGKIWTIVHSYLKKKTIIPRQGREASRTTRLLNPLEQRRWNSKGFGAEAEERRCVLGDSIAVGEHTVAVATVQECGFERPPCSAVWHPPTAACPQDKRPQRTLLWHPWITSLSLDCFKRRFQQVFVKRTRLCILKVEMQIIDSSIYC